MNKSIILGGLFTMAALTAQAQNSIFSCDFENGIPENFSTYDLDENEPTRGMKTYGFAVGTAWVAYSENETNKAAYSCSMYKTEAQSNDWLITPAISITDVRTILSWRTCATNTEHPDGYQVYISDQGNQPESFTGEPAITVEAESTSWKEHQLSLEAYAGKTIYIAFVNNSSNCELLMLDDINVFTHDHTFTFVNTTPEAISTAGNVKVTGTIASSGYLPVEGYQVELTHKGERYLIDKSAEQIQPGETAEVTFEYEIAVAQNETQDYTLTITSMDGTDVQTIESSITCFHRTVLVEEGTGTWCLWCPRGQYGLQLLHEKHPGEFIDIAAHYKDEMQIEGYGDIMFWEIFNPAGGIPRCIMDRKISQTGTPYYDGETLLAQAKAQGAIGTIRCSATLTVDNKIAVNTTSEFGKAIGENMYRLAVIIVEDSVTGYEQVNGLSGYALPMGGLELLPDPIPAGDYFFANVGRSIYPSLHGDSLAFAVGTPRHTPLEVSYLIDLPESIQRLDMVKVVAILIDEATKEVINAAEARLDITNEIQNIGIGEEEIHVATTNQGIEVTATSPLTSIEIWSLGGQLLHQAQLNTSGYVITGNVGQSAVILKIQTEQSSKTIKCVF